MHKRPKQMLLTSLTFENANTECEKAIRLWKLRFSFGDLIHATSGSAALDLTLGKHLTSQWIPCYKIDVQVYGPLSPG